MEGRVWEYVWGGIALCAMIGAWRGMEVLVWRPRREEREMASQGIRGPPYRILVGNLVEMIRMMVKASSAAMEQPFSHNILSRVLPFITEWSKIYGSTFVIWCGPTPRITVTEPELIREILLSKSDSFDRLETHPLVRQLEGGGLFNLQGERWAHRRKIISPFFHISNLSLFTPMIGKCIENTIEKWAASAEVEVSSCFDDVTRNVMSKVVCGDNYKDGEQVINLQARQSDLVGSSYTAFLIPGYSYLPTKMNIAYWSQCKKVQSILEKIIRERKEREEKKDKDLINILLDAARETPAAITGEDVAEECKTFLFAGKETTENLLSWMIVMLAMNPEWQELAREEVLRECRASGFPSSAQMGKLKTLSMIINETLRLYPPIVAIVRTANAHVEIGGRLTVPKGTQVLIPILALHHDPKLWGEDASEFNPQRFAERAAPAPAFMPFGHGARSCAGKNLAVLEAKLFMAILLKKFSFRLSPAYVHAPRVTMMLGPQHGVPVVFKLLSPDDGQDAS